VTESKPAPPQPAGPTQPPSGPTHPTPTHPPRGNGHALPPISDPRGAVHPATDQAARMCVPAPAGVGLTSLHQLVLDLRLTLAYALAMTQHQWDPASGPMQEDAPIGPSYVDRKLGNLRCDLRAALAEADELWMVLQSRVDHPVVRSGEMPTPGSAVAGASAACESDDGAAPSAGAGVDPGPGRRALSRPAKRTAGTGLNEVTDVVQGDSFTLPAAKPWSW
jgi:hypothetical protein